MSGREELPSAGSIVLPATRPPDGRRKPSGGRVLGASPVRPSGRQGGRRLGIREHEQPQPALLHA